LKKDTIAHEQHLAYYHRLRLWRFACAIAVFFAVVFGNIAVPPVAMSEIYTWTNKDGSLGMADDPGRIPPEYREKVRSHEGQPEQSGGRINYSTSKPDDTASAPTVYQPEEKTRANKPLTEEEKQKLDQELRGKWDGMKKALRGY